MRHAIHSGFLVELKNYPQFTFNQSPYNSAYVELASWPSSVSAQEAKDFLNSSGITVVTLDTDGSELEEEELS